MCAGTGLHGDDAELQLAEELQYLIVPQPLAQHHLTLPVRPENLEHILPGLSPTVIISEMTALLHVSSQTDLRTLMPPDW